MRPTIGLMCHDFWGGSGRISMDLVEQLGLNGYSAHAFTLSPPKTARPGGTLCRLHHVLPWSQTDRHSADLYREWTAEHYEIYLEMMKRGIKQHGIDLLHYHYAIPFAKIAADIRKSGLFPHLKIVGTLHGTDVTMPPRSFAYSEGLRDCLLEADLLTTVSIHHAELTKITFGLDEPPQVVPDFVDVSRYTLGKRFDFTGSDHLQKPKIVHISNFRPVKRPDQAVQVFASVRRQIDAKLWFAGNGPMRGEVGTLVRDVGLQDHVQFLGLIRDVPKILAQSDLVLITSREESFCLVALEAMAMGIPVLAPAIGGLSELITHGDNGLLYPPDDPEKAAKEAIEILTDSKKWWRIGRRAVQRASKFNRDDVAGIYEALYADLLSAKHQHA